ncbi:MAG: hypothetical protein ABIJ09_18205 [Pseudomonadota bacterium]
MRNQARQTGQLMLAELDRHIAIFKEMTERDRSLLHRLGALANNVDANDRRAQALRSKLAGLRAMGDDRERARDLLSARLSAIFAGEAKLEDCQRMLTARKQDLLARARDLNKPLRRGN